MKKITDRNGIKFSNRIHLLFFLVGKSIFYGYVSVMCLCLNIFKRVLQHNSYF